MHGTGICRVADKITGKERHGRIDPFAVYFDLGLKLGIKELLHGTSRHHTLDALAHYVFATVNDLDHIPHEHHPPPLSYVWLTGFGYGYARALVREGAPYSNPEPS